MFHAKLSPFASRHPAGVWLIRSSGGIPMFMTKKASRWAAWLSPLVALIALAGCQTTQQMLAADDEPAIHAAVVRGRFEMNCPGATGTVLSSTMLQPVLWGGIERAEYQIGIEGCGKRATYIVICPQDSSGCLATSNRDVPAAES